MGNWDLLNGAPLLLPHLASWNNEHVLFERQCNGPGLICTYTASWKVILIAFRELLPCWCFRCTSSRLLQHSVKLTTSGCLGTWYSKWISWSWAISYIPPLLWNESSSWMWYCGSSIHKPSDSGAGWGFAEKKVFVFKISIEYLYLRRYWWIFQDGRGLL